MSDTEREESEWEWEEWWGVLGYPITPKRPGNFIELFRRWIALQPVTPCTAQLYLSAMARRDIDPETATAAPSFLEFLSEYPERREAWNQAAIKYQSRKRTA